MEHHPRAIKEVKEGSLDFCNTLVKFMDMESNGTISKLSMYVMCDLSISPKEECYVFCDAVWEIMTGGSRSMGSAEFIDKLKSSETVRIIFYKLLLLQCMRPGEDQYGVPFSNKDALVDEVMLLTREWRRRKANGRFFALDLMLPAFKAAVDAKDNERMWRIFEDASSFQNKLRGQEAIKAGHYVKVMMGLLEAKTWNFALEEFDRVQTLVNGQGPIGQLSETQQQRFSHLLSVLEAFKEPGEETELMNQVGASNSDELHHLGLSGGAKIVRRKGDTLLGSAMGDVVAGNR